MKCKITKKKAVPVMSFGRMPLANGFLKKKDFKKEYFYELDLSWSESLSLLQLNNFPKPRKMFNKNYPFFSSSSEYMKIHFKDYAKWIKKNFASKYSNIIEIGSNDGTMLKNFEKFGDNYIGFEPSKSVADHAIKNKIKTLNLFFNSNSLGKIKKFIHNTDIVYAANVICHIPDLIELIKCLDKVLNANGLFIFEEPYLGSMLKKVSYDQIYDEHIYIFSLTSVKKIFNLFDFDLIDAIPQNTHGGSMRYVVSRKGKKPQSARLKKMLENENRSKINSIQSCLDFKKNCELSKYNIVNKLINFKKEGKEICGYGATSKSTTILNYCDIGPEIIDCIFDTTPEKINKYTPGMHIPVKEMKKNEFYKFDIAYLFAWNHKDEIFHKEKSFKLNGGQWFSHVKI